MKIIIVAAILALFTLTPALASPAHNPPNPRGGLAPQGICHKTKALPARFPFTMMVCPWDGTRPPPDVTPYPG